MELFKLFGTIAVKNTEANNAIDETNDKAASFSEKLSDKFTDIGSKATNLGKKFLPLSTAIGGIGAVSGKMALSFEDSMAEINTLLDDDSHLHGYENAVKSISRETGLSIENIAGGMYQAISSLGDGGQETEKIFNTMAKSAKAGGAEVSDSVALISAGMKGYNSVNDETAKRISDLAFQTAKLGVTTFPEMAKSMQPLFPLSNSLNLSYEDLFGSMATLTGVTGNTAEVSTQLKAVFSNLMKPTTAMEKLISQYGYSSAQAMLESKGFAGMLKIVQTETGGQADKMAELFSSTEAVTAMTALTGAQFDAFNYKLSEMGNATGATLMAYEKLNTSGDQLRKAWNNIKVTGLELGIMLIDILAPVIEKVAEKVSKFSDWFASLDDRTKKLIITIGGFLAAAGPVLIFLGNVATGIGSIISVGGKLIGGIGGLIGKISGGGGLISAIAAIPGPVWIVIGVLAALVTAGVAVYKNWDEIREWAGRVWDKTREIVGGAVDKIKGFFLGIINFVKNNWQALAAFLVNPFVGGFKLLYDNCESFRNFIDNFLGKIREGLHNFTSKILEKAGEFGKKFIEVGANIITGLWEGITSACTWLFDKVRNIFKKIIDIVKNLFGIHSPSTVFIEIGKNIIEGLIEGLKAFLQGVINVISNIVNLIVDGFNKLKNGIMEKVNELKENVVSKFHELKNSAVEKISTLRENAVGKFNELKDSATEKIENLRESASEKFSQLKENAVEKVDSLKENAVQKFNELKDRAVERVENLKEAAVDKFNQLKDKGTEKVNALKENAVSRFNELKDKAAEKINTLTEKGVAGFEALRAKGIEKFDGLRSGISEKLDAVKSFVSNTVDKLKSFFDFDWKLPHIKLPHFNISGSFSLDPPSIPHIGVEWYKKAMDNPVIMDKPTAFGINPAGQIMAGGEAGSEVVSGTETLMDMISAAVAENNSQLCELLDRLYSLLSEYLPMLANMQMVLDSGALVGELAQPLNEELGRIIHMRGRRN